MSLHRQNPRRDRNEGPIVDALRACGVKVWRVSGEGLPDLLCAYRGVWLPLEVKSEGGKLTEAQAKAFMDSPFAVVRTIDQALAYFGIKAGGIVAGGRAPEKTQEVARRDRTGNSLPSSPPRPSTGNR